jgi:FkbM family methyltransferase
MAHDLSAPESNLIYDVGGHTGQDTAYYLKKGFRVVTVEANPDLYKLLAEEKFAAEVKSGQLTVVGYAIAKQTGTVDFYVNKKLSIWGTIDPNWAKRNAEMGAESVKITVPSRTFEDILAENGMPYYLKIDIEGADLFCVEALQNTPSVPTYLSIESDKISWDGLMHELDLLESLGYKKYKIINQKYITSLQLPRPAREGKDVDHVFPHGATGPFGRELPGRWLSKAEAVEEYRKIFVTYRRFGDNTLGGRIIRYLPLIKTWLKPGWYDTHATTLDNPD